MKKIINTLLIFTAVVAVSCSSGNSAQTEDGNQSESTSSAMTGQSGVVDNESSKNIVQVASGSADHSTLVAAVKAAELVDALSNAGPFTVFAPTNAAFDALPAGTVDDLLKPENKDKLSNILEYHVSLAVYKLDALKDGQSIGQVNGDNISISIKDGKTYVNNTAEIVASIPTSNGLIHVLNQVILPPAK